MTQSTAHGAPYGSRVKKYETGNIFDTVSQISWPSKNYPHTRVIRACQMAEPNNAHVCLSLLASKSHWNLTLNPQKSTDKMKNDFWGKKVTPKLWNKKKICIAEGTPVSFAFKINQHCFIKNICAWYGTKIKSYIKSPNKDYCFQLSSLKQNMGLLCTGKINK